MLLKYFTIAWPGSRTKNKNSLRYLSTKTTLRKEKMKKNNSKKLVYIFVRTPLRKKNMRQTNLKKLNSTTSVKCFTAACPKISYMDFAVLQ